MVLSKNVFNRIRIRKTVPQVIIPDLDGSEQTGLLSNPDPQKLVIHSDGDSFIAILFLCSEFSWWQTDESWEQREEDRPNMSNIGLFLFWSYSNASVERSLPGWILLMCKCFTGPPIIKWHIFFPLAKRNKRESSGIFHSPMLRKIRGNQVLYSFPLLRDIRGNQVAYFISPSKSNKRDSSGIFHFPLLQEIRGNQV